jgi:hypothetical protein
MQVRGPIALGLKEASVLKFDGLHIPIDSSSENNHCLRDFVAMSGATWVGLCKAR